ncbi:MAG: response regulator [Anaerolineae bacterium]
MGTILIVEDNADMRDEMLDLLEFAGWSTLSPFNGIACLEIAGKHEPELIVCDVCMAQLKGDETLSRLRSDEKTAHIPFLVVTAAGNIN